jgi:hypothetical protein
MGICFLEFFRNLVVGGVVQFGFVRVEEVGVFCGLFFGFVVETVRFLGFGTQRKLLVDLEGGE